MLLRLIGLIKRTIVEAALFFVSSPSLRVRCLSFKFKQAGDLSEISKQYGVKLITLQKQRDLGLDNPAYRFHRDGGLFDYLAANAAALKGSSWLDVGADRGAVSLYLSEILDSNNFELCDITLAPRSNFPVKQIAGTQLDYDGNSFDMVLFSYVLHHAGDDTIQLLRDAWRIARKYVVVTEDPKDNDEDCLWACSHDKRGTFRGRKEWRQLFSITGFDLVHEELLNCEVHSRCFFLLAPNK